MDSLRGYLLIASPDLLDPNFRQAVVLIVQHGDEGALGLILNRPTETTLLEAWNQVSTLPCLCDDLLYQGGPCQGPLMVLHDQPSASEVTVQGNDPPSPGMYFCTESDKVEWVVSHQQQHVKFFVGYAGWSPGQLEEELASDSWLPLPATQNLVFQTPANLWQTLIEKLQPALPPRLLPKDPSLN